MFREKTEVKKKRPEMASISNEQTIAHVFAVRTDLDGIDDGLPGRVVIVEDGARDGVVHVHRGWRQLLTPGKLKIQDKVSAFDKVGKIHLGILTGDSLHK